MHLYEERRGGTLVLQPTGRLDSASSAAFERELMNRIEAGDRRLVLDLKEIDYVSSAGLRAFLIVAKRLDGVAGSLTLCALKNHVREVFEISGFHTLFRLTGSVDEALAGGDKR
jgi:anti-anti-sigma factor